MKLAIFEDDAVGHFKPLTHTRPAFDLRYGIFSFKQRIERVLHREADYLVCRDQVSGVASEMFGAGKVNPERIGAEPTLFINGRWIPEDGALLETLRAALSGDGPAGPVVWISEDGLVAGWHRLESDEVRDAGEARLVSRLWEFTTDPGSQITADLALFGDEFEPVAAWPDLTMVHEENVFIDEDADFGAGVILNASAGPIVIESEAYVGDGVILIGPCHIGKKARVNPGARISGSSVGFNCRAGGEISKSILHAHANKAHDGYLGNSYIGEWCNIGADANTSNLRNDYGPVTLFNEELGRAETTGQQFLGLIMGDHSACGINTMFNTGTVVGVGCNVFGAGYQPRHIKSFTWGGPHRSMPNRLDKVLAAAEIMMERRNRGLSQARRELLEQLAGSASKPSRGKTPPSD